FVAGFIGSPPMNFVDGTVTGQRVETPAGSFGVADGPTAGASTVTAGMRPESLVVGGTDLKATVVNIEMLGHERHLICRVGDANWTVRQLADAPSVEPGTEIGIGVDAAKVHLF